MRFPLRPIAWLWMAGAGGALASGCGKAADRAVAASAPSSARPAAAPSERPLHAPVPETRACSLLTPEEVGVIFGKKLESSESGSACEYGLAPSQANPLEQLLVKLEVSRDDTSEAEVKSRYAGLGKDVRRAVHPEKRGMPDTIAVGDDITGVGDWAFAVNVAAVNLGMGFSSREGSSKRSREPFTSWSARRSRPIRAPGGWTRASRPSRRRPSPASPTAAERKSQRNERPPTMTPARSTPRLRAWRKTPLRRLKTPAAGADARSSATRCSAAPAAAGSCRRLRTAVCPSRSGSCCSRFSRRRSVRAAPAQETIRRPARPLIHG